MGDVTTTHPLPRVAVLYEPDSVSLFKLARAVRGECEVVWVTDGPEVPSLKRFGSVIDAGGISRAQTVRELVDAKVAGITTFADRRLRRVAELATALDLPGNSVDVADRLVNKIAQRRAMAASGMAGPRFVDVEVCRPDWHRRRRIAALRYPVVVKPADGNGGRDVACLSDAAAVKAELERRRRAGDERAVVVEECLGEYPPVARNGFGDYVSVEAVVCNGVVSVVAVTGRMPLVEPFRETGAFLPAVLTAADSSAVAQSAIAAIQAVGVRFGVLHVEVKLTRAGPRIIEVNGRMGGGGIPDLVAQYTGVDLYRCAIRTALGRLPEICATPSPDAVFYSLALQPPLDARSELAHGWAERMRQIPGVEDIDVRAAHRTATAADGSYGYLAMVGGSARSHAELLDTHRRLSSEIVASQ